jgi:putative thioredoxin
VQSIPAVFAFRDGKGVDAFMGALPESQIRQFIEKNGGGESPGIKDAIAAANELLEHGDAPKAAELFAAVLQQASDNLDAIAGMARCYLSTGDLDHARKTLEMVPANKRSDSRIAGVQATIDLAGQSAETGDMEALRARLATDGDDHEARIELAVALNAAGERDAALAEIMESIRRDRHWNDDAARARLLTFFESWGPTDPLTLKGRRQLSSLLFS